MTVPGLLTSALEAWPQAGTFSSALLLSCELFIEVHFQILNVCNNTGVDLSSRGARTNTLPSFDLVSTRIPNPFASRARKSRYAVACVRCSFTEILCGVPFYLDFQIRYRARYVMNLTKTGRVLLAEDLPMRWDLEISLGSSLILGYCWRDPGWVIPA